MLISMCWNIIIVPKCKDCCQGKRMVAMKSLGQWINVDILHQKCIGVRLCYLTSATDGL